ncbi:MAG: hypothetical protein A2621_02470 [Alphaproteobacteria bacterium RIFCSPHIGHO2_01_FULL_41_14]|nr:MAG: hypothetical protein A2065_01970 [Alphaproteobacteria bacterium GWB1_45_5]OFW76667.1 MAG: hypothetical protein A3K20_00580 [Alphaproteobacteria bacterium GWA1_45_9]OFW89745.1 MAG: hypothetical protein A2621_02470 [Alphaproteobacteria bacterium RIFCSPHIGHO2_01_FULL_41_14]HCI48415.1 hypothetical protein [Holosporales bacterium]
MSVKHCFKVTPFHSDPPMIMNEFIRFLDVKKLTSLPATFTFVANDKEKEDLAKRLDLVVLKNLQVNCQVQGKVGEFPLQVSAVVKAEVIQSCVTTLKDLPDEVEEPIKLELFPSITDESTLPENFEEDQPEPVVLNKDGTVDVGEIFVQYLSLALDPYPKFEVDTPS